MLKALLWKEWRAQRSLVLATYPCPGGSPGTEPASAMLRTESLAFNPRTGEDRVVFP